MTYGHSVLPIAFILLVMLILLRSDSTSSINLSLAHPYFHLPPGVSSSNHFAVLSPSTLTCQSHSNRNTSITFAKVTDLNLLHVVASKYSRNILFTSNSKQYSHLSYVSIKIIHLCNYTLLLATGEVLKTFLEVILCKPFQLLRRILSDVSSIKKATPFNADFSRGTDKDQLWSQVIWMFHCCHIVPC